MKKSFLLPAIVLVGAGILTMGQAAHAARLKCTGADGKTACTASQVADLNAGIASGKRMHQPLVMDVDSVSLGKNGMLVCRKAGGGMCTDDQIDAIVSLASTTKSSSTPFHVTRTVDSASPMLMK
jgi:hypothetical protein